MLMARTAPRRDGRNLEHSVDTLVLGNARRQQNAAPIAGQRIGPRVDDGRPNVVVALSPSLPPPVDGRVDEARTVKARFGVWAILCGFGIRDVDEGGRLERQPPAIGSLLQVKLYPFLEGIPLRRLPV